MLVYHAYFCVVRCLVTMTFNHWRQAMVVRYAFIYTRAKIKAKELGFKNLKTPVLVFNFFLF